MRVHRIGVYALGNVLAVPNGVALGSQQPVARWALDARPAVIIGANETDTSSILATVVGATRLPNGSILVGDRGEYALRVFSPTGLLLRSYARKGSGPGEIRYLGRMFRCGDSVYTVDIGEGQRVSVFNADGHYARVFRFGAPPGQRTPYMSACNRHGDFAHLGWEQQRDMKAGVFRSVVPVWTSRADSLVGRIIDSVSGSERWGLVRDNQLRGTRPLPLGRQPVLGIGMSKIYVGSAERFQLRAVSRINQTTSIIQRPESPVAVTKSDIRDAMEREIANRGESSRKGVEEAYAEMTFPRTLPAYTDLVVDADDFIWVRHFPQGSQSAARWSVFDREGALKAEVEMPIHLEVLEIGARYVLGRYLEPQTAVPQVRLYPLNRASR